MLNLELSDSSSLVTNTALHPSCGEVSTMFAAVVNVRLMGSAGYNATYGTTCATNPMLGRAMSAGSVLLISL